MKQNSSRNTGLLATTLFALLLAACGGGGGSDTSATTPTSQTAFAGQGVYSGTTSNGAQSFISIFLENGDAWGIYTGTSFGLMQGHGAQADANGTFVVSNGIDFNLGNRALPLQNLSATFIPKSTVNGTATYQNSSLGSVNFSGAYQTMYDTPATLSSIAGSYQGAGGTLTDSDEFSITVDPSGKISAIGQYGCLIQGSIQPRPSGKNIFDVTVRFDSRSCGRSDSATGIALVNNGALIVAATTPGRTDALVGVGLKR